MSFSVTSHIRIGIIICYVIYVSSKEIFFHSVTKLVEVIKFPIKFPIQELPIAFVPIFRKINKHPPMV